MRIAVVGASGLVGAPLAELLEAQGHEVRRLHRHSASFPVDLSTGAGLERALAGVEVIVNAANAPLVRTPTPVLIEGTRRLLELSDAHHVCVSIVGIEALAGLSRYYRAKLEQEALISRSGRPYSIVRCTQFHEFVGAYALRLARWRVELRGSAPLAPISAAEAAVVLARTAAGAPTRATANVVGPERLSLTQLRAGRGLPVPVPMLGSFGRALSSGALTHEQPNVRGVLTYGQWLSQTRGRPWRPRPKSPTA